MASPTKIARVDPTGIHLDDGHSTKIALQNDANINFWEKIVAPPGLDGGDAIDISTMFNSTYRTFAPRSLVTMTDTTITAAYDPILYDEILAQLNLQQSITVTFPDGSTLSFFGFVRLFEPQDNEEGTQPEASITITPTNYDPVNRVEAAAETDLVAGT
jgi:hypothetical protein